MSRWISNLVLGLFTLILVTAYGVAKQPSVYTPEDVSRIQNAAQLQLSGKANDDDSNVDAENSVELPSGESWEVLVATTEAERLRGLSGREGLPEKTGMLFVFDTVGNQSMWMKDMLFPIDIVWLDVSGQVVHVEDNVPVPDEGMTELPTYASSQPAKYVLELPAGEASVQQIEVGSRLALPDIE